MNSDAALPVAVDRCNCILRSLDEKNARVCQTGAPVGRFFSRLCHFRFDVFSTGCQFQVLACRIMRVLVMPVKGKSVSVRIQSASMRKVCIEQPCCNGATLLHELLLNLHSAVVNAIKRYLSFFKGISAYHLPFRSVPIARERHIFFPERNISYK